MARKADNSLLLLALLAFIVWRVWQQFAEPEKTAGSGSGSGASTSTRATGTSSANADAARAYATAKMNANVRSKIGTAARIVKFDPYNVLRKTGFDMGMLGSAVLPGDVNWFDPFNRGIGGGLGEAGRSTGFFWNSPNSFSTR